MTPSLKRCYRQVPVGSFDRCHRRKWVLGPSEPILTLTNKLTAILKIQPHQPKGSLVYESEFEKNLYQQRRDKLQQIAALGALSGLSHAQATYPNSYAASHTIPELRAAYDHLTAEQLEIAPCPIEVSITGSSPTEY
jgi:hypothetical protein